MDWCGLFMLLVVIPAGISIIPPIVLIRVGYVYHNYLVYRRDSFMALFWIILESLAIAGLIMWLAGYVSEWLVDLISDSF